MPDRSLLRVLVTDKDRDAADSLAALVRAWRHEVHVTYDGPSAVQLAEAVRPHAAIIELEMPGMDGVAIVRQLRRIPGMEKALLLCLSASKDDGDRRRCAEAGFDGYMTKPADFGELKRLLEGCS